MLGGGQECVLLKLASENDELLKTYLNNLVCERLSATLLEHQRELENLILRLQGLPAQENVTELEAAVLYNYGIAKIHNHCLHTSQSDMSVGMELQVKRFLQRVGFQRKGDSILEYLPNEVPAGFQSLIHVVVVLMVYALNCLLTRDFSSSNEILKFVSCCLPKMKVSDNLKALTFPIEGLFVGVLPKLQGQQMVELTNSAYLCLAITSAKMCEYSAALLHLESVSLQSYEDHRALIKGYCLYKQRNYTEALSSLHKGFEEIGEHLREAFCYLKALCYHKQHKVELAIQQLKHCLVAEFSGQSISLRLLSQLFETIGMRNVQTETLHLIVRKLKREKCDKQQQQQGHIPQMTLNLFLCFLFGDNITLNEALYSHGRTCFLNERYEASGKSYLELVDNILKSGIVDECRKGEEAMINLPSIATIFIEAAEALVKSNRPKEAIAVCDHLLDRSSNVVNTQTSFEQSGHSADVHVEPMSNVKKRQLSQTEVELFDTKEADILAMISALRLKSEALLMLSDTENSLECINRCLQSFEDYCDRNGTGIRDKNLSPPRKCQKLEEGAANMERPDPPLEHTMADVYACMARILVTKSDHQVALHWSRMALSSKPEKKAYKDLHASISNHLTGRKNSS